MNTIAHTKQLSERLSPYLFWDIDREQFDADPQAMPKMFIPTSWEEMKTAVSSAVNNYQKR